MKGVESAAYHEAGHAVASCLLDIPFSHTTIMPSEEGGYVGYTKAVPKDNLSQQEVLDEMVVLASGIVGASFLPGSHTDNRCLAESDDDLNHIREYAAKLAATTDEGHRYEVYQAYVDQAHIRAGELLRTPSHRQTVKRVAEALLEKHILDYGEVQQIVDQTTK